MGVVKNLLGILVALLLVLSTILNANPIAALFPVYGEWVVSALASVGIAVGVATNRLSTWIISVATWGRTWIHDLVYALIDWSTGYIRVPPLIQAVFTEYSLRPLDIPGEEFRINIGPGWIEIRDGYAVAYVHGFIYLKPDTWDGEPYPHLMRYDGDVSPDDVWDVFYPLVDQQAREIVEVYFSGHDNLKLSLYPVIRDSLWNCLIYESCDIFIVYRPGDTPWGLTGSESIPEYVKILPPSFWETWDGESIPDIQTIGEVGSLEDLVENGFVRIDVERNIYYLGDIPLPIKDDVVWNNNFLWPVATPRIVIPENATVLYYRGYPIGYVDRNVIYVNDVPVGTVEDGMIKVFGRDITADSQLLDEGSGEPPPTDLTLEDIWNELQDLKARVDAARSDVNSYGGNIELLYNDVMFRLDAIQEQLEGIQVGGGAVDEELLQDIYDAIYGLYDSISGLYDEFGILHLEHGTLLSLNMEQIGRLEAIQAQLENIQENLQEVFGIAPDVSRIREIMEDQYDVGSTWWDRLSQWIHDLIFPPEGVIDAVSDMYTHIRSVASYKAPFAYFFLDRLNLNVEERSANVQILGAQIDLIGAIPEELKVFVKNMIRVIVWFTTILVLWNLVRPRLGID